MRHKTKNRRFGWQPETEFFVSINERRKMNKFYKAMVWIRMMVATAGILLSATSAVAEEQVIATLHSFNGDIMMKSSGAWGVAPQNGMPLYNGDKIVTAAGSNARISFHDGSVLNILSDSNVYLSEPASDAAVKEREIRLSQGKAVFSSSRDSATETTLVSPKATVVASAGSETLFGADGELAFTTESPGKSSGSDIRPASDGLKYKSIPESERIRQAYIESVKKLLTGMDESKN
jgi:hypothetical protein